MATPANCERRAPAVRWLASERCANGIGPRVRSALGWRRSTTRAACAWCGPKLAGRSATSDSTRKGTQLVRGDTAPPPSRADVEARLTSLVDGTGNRGQVAAWAMQWVDARDPGDIDDVVGTALNNLVGADSPSTDRLYLYDRQDFKAWLDELRAG
jgi:hypothetical protein